MVVFPYGHMPPRQRLYQQAGQKVFVTSTVAASSRAATVLVRASGSLWRTLMLIALESPATEASGPAVEALVRWWASLSALLVVLLDECVGFFALQLYEDHLVQELASIRQHVVG